LLILRILVGIQIDGSAALNGIVAALTNDLVCVRSAGDVVTIPGHATVGRGGGKAVIEVDLKTGPDGRQNRIGELLAKGLPGHRRRCRRRRSRRR
jgi:hypothetical protein